MRLPLLLALSLSAASLALACSSSNSRAGGGGATVRFAQPVHYTLSGAQYVAVGDFDGDKNLDILVAASELYVAYGAGDGTFGAPQAVTSVTDAVGKIQVFDANGDGRDDAFVALATSGAVEVLFGNKDRTLATPEQLTVADHSAFSLADVDGDGQIDVLSNNDAASLVTYLNKGGGTVRETFQFNGFTAWFAKDLNRDGRADLVGPGTNVALTPKDGKPATFVTDGVAGGAGPFVISAFDANRDGIADICSVDADLGFFCQLANGDGTLAPAVGTTNPYCEHADWFAVAFGDLDGDDIADVLTTADCGSGPTFGVLHGDGKGGFQADAIDPPNMTTSRYSVSRLADLNHDGKNDFVYLDDTSFVVALHE